MAEDRRSTSFSFHAQLNTPSSALTFQIVCTLPSYIYQLLNAAFSALFHFIRIQFITYFNQTISFTISLLTTLLQLKCQGINDQNKTPFSIHPRTMLVAVSSCAVYCLANMALLQISLRGCFAVVARHCLVWSACTLVASLASVFFPDSVSPFVYAVFLLLSAAELLYLLYHKLKLLVDEDAVFQVVSRRVHRFLNTNTWRVAGSSSGQWPQSLPV